MNGGARHHPIQPPPTKRALTTQHTHTHRHAGTQETSPSFTSPPSFVMHRSDGDDKNPFERNVNDREHTRISSNDASTAPLPPHKINIESDTTLTHPQVESQDDKYLRHSMYLLAASMFFNFAMVPLCPHTHTPLCRSGLMPSASLSSLN